MLAHRRAEEARAFGWHRNPSHLYGQHAGVSVPSPLHQRVLVRKLGVLGQHGAMRLAGIDADVAHNLLATLPRRDGQVPLGNPSVHGLSLPLDRTTFEAVGQRRQFLALQAVLLQRVALATTSIADRLPQDRPLDAPLLHRSHVLVRLRSLATRVAEQHDIRRGLALDKTHQHRRAVYATAKAQGTNHSAPR